MARAVVCDGCAPAILANAFVRIARHPQGRKSRSPAVRICDGAPIGPRGGLRLQASGIGVLRAHRGGPVVQAVPRQHVLGHRRADRRQPRRAGDRRGRDQIGDLVR